MTKFPLYPALHECSPRGKQSVYALRGGIDYPDGSFVPRTFKTDGASRPWFLGGILERFGRGFSAFIKHDYDYCTQLEPRRFADDYLIELLDHEDVPEEDRFTKAELKTIRRLLKWFGWIAWRKNARRPRHYFFCPEGEMNS